MSNKAERAKQFLPFDALKGLQEALREKEIEYETKRELAEERLEELDQEFNKIQIGDKAKIKYYRNGKYIDRIGKITDIDYLRKKIQIDKTCDINMSDILNLNKRNKD